ncbi:MAG: nickel-dependent lactate racemase [Spirochaetota bacterium]
MYLTFPYPEIYPVDIPDKNITAFLKPKETEHTEKSEEEVIKDGLRNPIGSPPISQIVKKGQKILILVDDYTRSTPTNTILPQVINKLRAAGISHNNITLLIASGTHRKMTLQEKIKKYGSSIVTNYPIKDHLWNNAREIVQLPKTRNGTEIWVNKALLNADFIIGVGHIVPHRVSGFSGGCKIVQPGVCGAVTTGQTHWLSALFDGPEIMGKIDNPVREEINEVGIKAGLKFIVNPVLDGEGHMVHCLCGAPVEAHREGCRRAMEVFGAHLSEKADIVIADSYPADMELWQASKGIYSADLALKPGGVIMLVTPCPEGISSEHPKIMEFG